MSMEIKSAEFVTSMADYGPFTGRGLPQIAVAGKSNVGKSTLINRLCRRNKLARTSSTPGKTRLLNVFLLNEEFHLIDLPGYGFAKVSQNERDRWAGLMESFFAENETFDAGVLIVDARHKPTADDVRMAEYFKNAGHEFVVLANKLDKLKKSEIEPAMALIRQTLSLNGETELIPFSAEKGDGRERLLSWLLRLL
jgi:GTP-binding protein